MTTVLLRFLYGTTAVMAVPRRSWRCRGDPTADCPNPRRQCGSFEHVQISAVPPRRSAVLTVFRGATAINDGTTAEPRRSWRCHCGLCHTSTAVAPRLRCDGTSTAEARRNMLTVAAVPPRRSAVLTVCHGATTINDGTTAKPLRSWQCRRGLCRTSTAVAPPLRCDGGITSILITTNVILLMIRICTTILQIYLLILNITRETCLVHPANPLHQGYIVFT